MKNLDKYVIFSISVLLVYTVLNIILTCFNIHISDVLTASLFTAFGTELLHCAMIKKLKLKGKDDV